MVIAAATFADQQYPHLKLSSMFSQPFYPHVAASSSDALRADAALDNCQWARAPGALPAAANAASMMKPVDHLLGTTAAGGQTLQQTITANQPASFDLAGCYVNPASHANAMALGNVANACRPQGLPLMEPFFTPCDPGLSELNGSASARANLWRQTRSTLGADREWNYDNLTPDRSGCCADSTVLGHQRAGHELLAAQMLHALNPCNPYSHHPHRSEYPYGPHRYPSFPPPDHSAQTLYRPDPLQPDFYSDPSNPPNPDSAPHSALNLNNLPPAAPPSAPLGKAVTPYSHPPPHHTPSKTSRPPYDWMKSQNYKAAASTGKTRTKDKYRVVYSDHQRLELEKEFHFSKYITIKRKAELAQSLNLSERQVKIWFQNRRAKERKITKKQEDQGVMSLSSIKAHSTESSEYDELDESDTETFKAEPTTLPPTASLSHAAALGP